MPCRAKHRGRRLSRPNDQYPPFHGRRSAAGPAAQGAGGLESVPGRLTPRARPRTRGLFRSRTRCPAGWHGGHDRVRLGRLDFAGAGRSASPRPRHRHSIGAARARMADRAFGRDDPVGRHAAGTTDYEQVGFKPDYELQRWSGRAETDQISTTIPASRDPARSRRRTRRHP